MICDYNKAFMLEVGTYTQAEISELLGTTDTQGINRKLERYGIAFERKGRSPNAVYTIQAIPDPFKIFAIIRLGFDANTDFRKLRKVVKTRREGVDAFKALKLTERSLKVFSMYGGTEETITLRFSNHLIGVVLDRFGRDIRISPDDDRHFKITVKVEVSPQFYGWLCGLGTGVRVIHPEEVAQKMGEYVRSIAKMY